MIAGSRCVTVLIAAYNVQATIARAVASALAQPEVAEVVVIDDASGDNTLDAARAADDGAGRLKLLRQEKNQGPSAARNRGIAESSAPWIAVLDADDFYLPGRMAGLLAASAGYDFVADDILLVSEGQEQGPHRALFADAYALPMDVDFCAFVEGNVTQKDRARGELGFMNPLISRAFLERNNLRFQEQMRLGEDYELFARALAHGARMRLIPAQGYVAVVREDSLSARHSIADLQALRESDAALLRDFSFDARARAALKAHYDSIDCRLQWRVLIEAVKARKVKQGVGCFRSPVVSAYLARQLAAEIPKRLLKRAA